MAKVVSDEILKLKIIVNGDEAQKKILDLEVANNELAKKIVDLKTKEKELSKNRAQNAVEISKIKSEIQGHTKAIAENNRAIDEEVRSMNIMNLTVDQLRRRINDLNFTMKHMDPNSEAFATNRTEVEQLSNRLRDLRTGASDSSNSLRSLFQNFNRYSGVVVAFAGALAGVALSMQGVIDLNNKMADAMSGIEKTTGMAADEVKELTRSFDDFDTRTSKIDLLKIAEMGGRLGVPKSEIKDFVREVDKAYIALGDSFQGGVEKVAESIGKIAGLYKETKELDFATSINQIGSALNELGANGAATEENISDFARRVGALPEALKPSITDALALGAAFQESGIDAERSGTAYANFVSTAAKETAKFAKVMNITEKQVKEMLNSDPTEFFLKFSNGLKGMNATDVATTLDYLKVGDQYVKSIVGAASENTDRFRKSMEISAQAAKEATSLQEEFDKVNNNSAAIYEKVRKKFMAMFTSDEVAKSLNWIITTIGKLLGVVDDTSGRITIVKEAFINWLKIIIIATTAVLSYNAAITLSNLTLATIKERLLAYTVVQKVNNLLNQSGIIFQNAWNLAVGYGQLVLGRLTASTNMQIAAQTRLSLVTSVNPYGAVIAVVMALVAAYVLFSQKTDEAAEKQKRLNQITADAEKGIVSQKNELELLLKVARDENAAKEKRLAAIKKLNEISPEYLGNLTLENINTQKAADAVKAYTDALIRNSRIKVLTKKLDEVSEQKIDREKMSIDEQEADDSFFGSTIGKYLNPSELRNMDVNMFKQMSIWTKKYGESMAKVLMAQYGYVYENRAKALQKLNSQSKEYADEIAELNKIPELNSTESKSNYTVPIDKVKPVKKTKEEKDSENAQKRYERERKKILETAENYNQKMEELEAERLRSLAELQQEGYQKEHDLLIAEQEKTIAELEKKKIKDSDLVKLRTMIAKEKGNMKKKLQEIEFQWLEENGRLSGLQELELEKTKFKLLTLDEKYIKDSYKKQEEALENKLKLLEREYNYALTLRTTKDQKDFLKTQGYSEENLSRIRTWEEGRNAIEKEFQRKRLEEQITYLNKSLAEFQVLIATTPGLISPEQIKILQDYENQIAKLLAEITKLKNGDDKKLGGKLNGIGGSTDLLGLSPDQWTAMFTNTDNLSEKMQKIGASIKVAKEMFSMYSSFVQANEQKMLQVAETSSQRKQTRLDKQLKAGVITQEVYKKATIANEKELDRRKAEIEYQQAKRQRAMQVAETIANTAMAIMSIWAQFPKFDFGATAAIMSGVVGALGLTNVAMIMSQPMPTAPGAEDGYYPVLRQQDNKMFRARKKRATTGMYDEPTMLVGEAGSSFPELVVSGKDLKKIDPTITDMFMRDIARVRGYEDGLYPTLPTTSQSTSNNDELMIKTIATLERYSDVMEKIERHGIMAKIVKSAENGRELDEMQKEYLKLLNRNKH